LFSLPIGLADMAIRYATILCRSTVKMTNTKNI
jgi:hypothetical protein